MLPQYGNIFSTVIYSSRNLARMLHLFNFRCKRLLKLANDSADIHKWRVRWWLWHYDWASPERRPCWGIKESWHNVCSIWYFEAAVEVVFPLLLLTGYWQSAATIQL